MFSGIADGYLGGGARLSLGQDPRWREFLVERIDATPGDHVLDVATGTGAVAIGLARRYGCSVTGLDQSADMLAHGRRNVEGSGLTDRVKLVQGEAERLPYPEASFDHLTVTYLLRYVADPAATLRELARVVRTGGRIASLEFGVPPGRVPRLGWHAYSRLIAPAIGRSMSSEWASTMRFLARDVPRFWREHSIGELVDMYRAAGIEELRVKRLTFGAGVVIWGERRT